jgi:ABC-type transporter Mla subunit MlaD
MSSPVESFFTATVRGQEATTSALRTWTDGLQAFTGAQSTLSEAPAMITRYFDAVQQVLDIQRQFAETMVEAAQSAQTVMKQVAGAAEDSADAAHAATNGLADVTRAAKGQTRAVTRATKVATS